MTVSNITLKCAASCCASLIALCAANSAEAQENRSVQVEESDEVSPTESSSLDEIIVTARRRDENAQDVPVSIVAHSGEALARQNVYSLTDLPRVAPGLTITPSALGGTRPVYQIRGQRAAATRITTDPAVMVYFAEVGSARAAGSAQSMFDIDSVQVLKGPQGTLFGRNTTGGAILITPAAPTREFEGYLRGGMGNFNMTLLEGALNIPVSDALQLRLAVRKHRRDGYFENVARPGEKAFDENNESYRATIRFQPADGITSDTIGTIFHSDTFGFQPKIVYYNPDGVPAPSLIPAIEGAVARSTALDFYEYTNPSQPFAVDTTRSIQNNTTFQISDNIMIKNIIAYKRIKNNFSNLADGSDLSIISGDGSYRGWQFSEELQVQGDYGAFDFVAGAFYSAESGRDITRAVNFGGPASYTDFHGDNTSLSGFVHASVELGSALTLNAGARLTYDKREVISHQRQDRSPPICLASGTATAMTDINDLSQCSFKTTASFTEPTWNIGLNYQLTPDNMLYVAHRHGYRSGAARSAQAPNLRPETVNDIEIGSKNDFWLNGVPVRFNLVGYYGWYKDLQRNIATDLNGVAVTQDRNAAEARVYGLESELSVQFTDFFRINANYALTKAKYDRYENSFVTPDGIIVVDNTSSIFSYTPEHMLSATAAFDIPVPESLGRPSFSLTYTYQSSFQTTDSNSFNCGPGGIEKWCLNTVGNLPGYDLLNARIDWRNFMDSPVDLSIFVTNLENNEYYAGAFSLVNVLGFASAWPGQPRMFGVEARVRFGAMAD